jgi:hypothetical protein
MTLDDQELEHAADLFWTWRCVTAAIIAATGNPAVLDWFWESARDAAADWPDMPAGNAVKLRSGELARELFNPEAVDVCRALRVNSDPGLDGIDLG